MEGPKDIGVWSSGKKGRRSKNGLSQKEKGLVDVDISVGLAGGRGCKGTK